MKQHFDKNVNDCGETPLNNGGTTQDSRVVVNGSLITTGTIYGYHYPRGLRGIPEELSTTERHCSTSLLLCRVVHCIKYTIKYIILN